MKSFHGFDKGHDRYSGRHGLRSLRGALLAAVVLATALGMARPSSGQVVHAGQAEGDTLFAGATASGYYLQYGERKMLGFTGFVDADTRHHFGLEAEGSWALFHQTANVHATIYDAGPRYRMTLGRYQPYAKAMVGLGQFNFPYNYAHGNYLVVAPGGGVDFRLSRGIRLRLADAEYQYWPQFTYGAMSTISVSTGIRVRIF